MAREVIGAQLVLGVEALGFEVLGHRVSTGQ